MRFIRPKTDHILKIQKLVSEAFEISEEFAKQIYSRDKLKGLFQKNLSFILIENDTIVGVVCGYPDSENPVVIWLELLLVNKSVQRRGLGTKIMNFYERYLISHKYGQILLYTETINPEARAFYKKIGYKQVGYLDYLPKLRRIIYRKIINQKIINKEFAKYRKFL